MTKDMTSTKAVIYARVTVTQNDRSVINNQLNLLRRYAERMGLNVVQEFIYEPVDMPGRKAFEEMVAFLKANDDVRTVIVENEHRLHDSANNWRKLMKNMCVEVLLAKDG